MSSITIDSVNYSLSGTDATIIGYDLPPDLWNLVISSTITYLGIIYNVIGISDNAFNSCTNLISITFPDSVKSIGNSAFVDCTGLKNITLPITISSIGDTVFQGCSTLKRLFFNASVTTISNNAFKNCFSLKTVIISSPITSIGANAFNSCTSLVNISFIPTSVTSIGNYAFADCTGLIDVTIPNSIKTIGNYVFQGCTSLINIVIQTYISQINMVFFEVDNSNTSYTFDYIGDIPENACKGRLGITSVIITDKIKNQGNYAFSNCTSLETLTIYSSVISQNKNAFSGCTSLKNLVIKSYLSTLDNIFGVLNNSISSYTFDYNGDIPAYICGRGRPEIKSVIIGDKIAYIGEHAFEDCVSLERIVIPSNITDIGDHAFSGCTSLIYIEINAFIKNLGIAFFGIDNPGTSWILDYAGRFEGNFSTKLISGIKLGNRITSIYGLFQYCPNLKDIVIPNSVTSIYGGAFYSCPSLTSITIPASVTSIGDYAFQLTGLTNIVIKTYLSNFRNVFYGLNNPNSSWTFDYNGAIPDSALEGANATSITIGNGITTIGQSSFQGCTGLTDIYIPNSVKNINKYAFYYCIGLKNVVIPFYVKNIDDYAFLDCTELTTVTIYSPNINISDNAFQGCNKLKNIIKPPIFQSNGILYEISENNVNIIGYDSESAPSSWDLIIPYSVTSIGNTYTVMSVNDSAFKGCTNLVRITIPSYITSIGKNVFSDCTNLIDINIQSNLSNLVDIFSGLNNPNMSWTFNYNGNIPDSICNGRTGLTSVKIFGEISSIGANAFSDCNFLKNIIISSSSVTSIGDYAFSGCSILGNIILTQDIPTLGNNIFLNSPARFKISSSFTIPNQVLSDITYTIIDPIKPLNSTSNWVYTSSNTDIATIEGNIITFVKTGIVVVIAILESDNFYTQLKLKTPFTIVEGDTASTFTYTDPLLVNSTILNILNETETITISPEILTPEILAATNPTEGTKEEKMANRDNIISNVFETFDNISQITAPVETFYLPPEIDTANVTDINLFNTATSSEDEPVIFDFGDFVFFDIIFCLLDNPGESVNYYGTGDNSNYSVAITKNMDGTFDVLKKNGDEIVEYLTASSGDSFDYAGLTIIIGSVTAQLNGVPTNNIDNTGNTGNITVSPICFPAGTPVFTDQGITAIEKINVNNHTIRGNKIVAITKTVTIEDKIVCIEKDALGTNIPYQKTCMSRNHKLLYNKQMIKAKDLVGKINGIHYIKYSGEILYNVLMETHNKMIINNLIVETLDPKNSVARLYTGSRTKNKNVHINMQNNGNSLFENCNISMQTKKINRQAIKFKNLSSISFNSYNSELNNKYEEKRKNEYRFLR